MSKTYLLDLSPGNSDLYRDCKVTDLRDGKYRLDTPLDSAVVIVQANAVELLKRVKAEGYDAIQLTGGVPDPIKFVVYGLAQVLFCKISHFNGNSKIEIDLPQPPEDLDGEPE